MSHRYRRTERVEELLKQEIARIVREEVKDPRVGFATVMRVTVSPDLRHARVFVSVLGSEEEKVATLDALRRASGFIRARVGDEVTLKYLPELNFEIDRSLERVARIEALIEEARPDPPNELPSGDEPETEER
jgi:ribosome-binding factor A